MRLKPHQKKKTGDISEKFRELRREKGGKKGLQRVREWARKILVDGQSRC